MAASVRFEPDDVAAATFPVARRGYDTDEVRSYLRSLAAEVGRLRRECDELRTQLTAKPRDVAALDEAQVAQALGEEAARVLTTAREAATQIRAKSEEAAAALVDEANEDAARTREHADLEAARLRQEAISQADGEVEAAKREGREMVAEARAVRERMLDDVRRRREVAKGQLEQLRLGHERVLGTFELAADALAAVTADLRALVPDVRRNSAVETGPLPTVLPRGEREPMFDAEADEALAPAAPSPVHVSVPLRAAALDEVHVDAVLDDAAPDDEPERPTVLLSAFSLGEAPAVEPVAEHEVEVDEVEPVAAVEPVDEVEVEVEVEPVADVEEPAASVEEQVDTPDELDDVIVEPVADEEPEPEDVVADERSVEHEHDDHHRPSADDLFARIRAARAAVATESVAAPAAVVEPERERVRAAVLVADPADRADPYVDVVAVRAEALAPVELAVARRLKRALADEQNEVLDRLRRKNPVLTLDALVGTLDDHAAPYQEAVRHEIDVAISAGARSLRPELSDADLALQTAGVAGVVLTAARDEVVVPLRERLARLLDEAGDAAAAADGVRTLYREWKTQKLDAGARHLALAAHGQAAYAVLVPGTLVCWTVDPSQPCPDGEDNTLGGPTPAGEEFPTGHRSAPAYVGCRCALAPAAR